MTLGKMANAWLAAATFERARLKVIICPTNQGLNARERQVARERCEKDIMMYEERAKATIRESLKGVQEPEEVAA